jgi:hypothetical protein
LRARIREIAELLLVLVLMDQLYRVLHPEVNLTRACLVGASAWATLRASRALGLGRVLPTRGALAVSASAFGSVLLIESGWLVSRSPTSAVVHTALLAAAWPALDGAGAWVQRRRSARIARTSSSGTSSGGGSSAASDCCSSRSVSR